MRSQRGPAHHGDKLTSYRPKLRPHIRVENDQLVDELLQRGLVLEGAAAALAPRLDGATDWASVRNELIESGHSDDAVDRALRRLLLLHAVEGAGDASVARLERVLRGEEALPTSILEGARFGCQGSGACCQGYAFGPLTDADVAGLAALDIARAFPHVERPYIEETERGRYLRHDGGRCVFLTAERRCGLHAAFGSEAKPGFCRLFPLESFATIEGIRVVDRGTCATFAVSARVGLPLVDDLARVRPLLPAPVLHHPVVIVEEWAWDYAVFLRFTTAATTLVKRRIGTPAETLVAIGRCLDALITATAHCSLDPGQPEAAVTDVLAIDGASWYRTPDDEAALAGMHALSELFRDCVSYLMADYVPGETLGETTDDFVELLEQAARMIDADARRGSIRSRAPAGFDIDDALRISMRQQLFGRYALVSGRAPAGLLRIAVIQLLALAGARLEAGERALTVSDLNRGHVAAVRAFETGGLDATLLEHEPRWRVILDGVAGAAQALMAARPFGTSDR